MRGISRAPPRQVNIILRRTRDEFVPSYVPSFAGGPMGARRSRRFLARRRTRSAFYSRERASGASSARVHRLTAAGIDSCTFLFQPFRILPGVVDVTRAQAPRRNERAHDSRLVSGAGTIFDFPRPCPCEKRDDELLALDPRRANRSGILILNAGNIFCWGPILDAQRTLSMPF